MEEDTTEEIIEDTENGNSYGDNGFNPNVQQGVHINITTLDLLFNYINNSESENLTVFDFEEMRMHKENKTGLINVLKRLDLFVENVNVLEFVSEEKQLDFKVQYWVVKELYESPYKCLLNKLTGDEVKLRFLKTKEYKDYSDITAFVAYFKKCLENELVSA